ncbi:MAG: helix-turn-helix domain-containing protein [Lentisphaeria bacterium]|nr:helix-turn-helix domain-containing protein [Lentisphaeria bacterium]
MLTKAEKFGTYLRKLRGKKSQGELAAVIDKTAMYISNIEKGKNNPPDEAQLEKIATELKLSDKNRFELIDKAAWARDSVAHDICDKLCKYEDLRQIIRIIPPGVIKQLKMLLEKNPDHLLQMLKQKD